MKKINFNQIPEYIAGKNIEDIKKLYKIKKVIKLASNENPYKLPKSLINTLKKNLREIYRYPDKDYKNLKLKIAEKLNLAPENIIVGNGTDELIDLAFKAKYLLSKNLNVLLFYPSFSLYEILSKIYNANIIKVELNDFEYEVNKIIKKIEKNPVDLISLCNPNNPTGTYVNNTDLFKLVENIKDDTLLLIDEAYYNYATAKDFPDSVELFKHFEKSKNIFITRTFSKIYGIAGLRIGYAFGNKKFIELLNKIRMPFNVNLLAEKAAINLLENDKFVKKCYIKNYKNKIFLYRELDKLNLYYKKSEANFILIRLPIKAQIVFEKLLKKGIIIRTIQDKGMENFIRLTIGKRSEVKKFLKELKRILK